MKLSIALILLLPSFSWGATYYVDFVAGSDFNSGLSKASPWKRAPGMTGATGAAAAAAISGGDTIVFKGGTTWTASWPWNIVGGFFTINDLKIYRCGLIGTLTSAACFFFTDTHDVAITNNTFDGRTWFTIYFLFDSAGTRSNFTVSGNDFANSTAAIWFASLAANANEKNFVYTNNTIHDFASMLGCSGTGCSAPHGDGFLHYFSIPNADSTQYIDGFTFCNNRSYGDFTRGIGSGSNEDMTAFFFVEGAIKNTLICNNDIGWTPQTNAIGASAVFGDGILFLRSYGNPSAGLVSIYNNTFGGDPTQSEGSAVLTTDSGWPALNIKNSIASIGTYCTSTEGGATPIGVSDYNLYRCPNGFAGTWIADGGHSLGPPSDPAWVSPFTDLRLTASSPAIGKGQNLSGLGLPASQQTILNSDRTGAARGSSWDIGAYQFAASSLGTVPAKPAGLALR